MASPLRSRLAAVGLAVLVALAVGCGGSDSSIETTTRTIVRNEPAPGLPYLLYLSDRDGDEDVYGVRADGKRSIQITRDEAEIKDAYLSPDWQWLYLLDGDYRPRVVSADGRRAYRLATGFGGEREFSRDGSLLAYSEDEDVAYPLAPRVWVMRTDTGRSRVVGHGEIWSVSPDSSLLVIFDAEADAPDYLSARLTFVDAVTGRTVRALDIPWPDDAAMYEVGWSPSGSDLAFVNGLTLMTVDITGDSWEGEAVVRDPRLDREAWYDMPVRWLDDETLAVQLSSEVDDEVRSELLTVDLDGHATVLADVSDYPDFRWSPDGDRVAFAERKGESGAVDVVTLNKNGSDRRVAFQARYPSFVWSPDGRLLVTHEKAGKRVLELVDPDGTTEEIFRTRGYAQLEEWSPDGRFLSLGKSLPAEESSSAKSEAIGILSLTDRSVVRAPVGGNVAIIGWADSRVGGAGAPSKPSPVEVASGSQLDSKGEIAEISASGPRVAAIVESSKLDCRHVVAWEAGRSRVVRFAKPRPCSGEEEELVGIALEGTRLTWTGESWGNYAYLTGNSADMRHPESGVRSSGGDEGYESGVDRPKPERATRRGVSVRVDHGAVVLARGSDGRTMRLLAPGPVVDAELEDEGLFYAYNTGGTMKGHIVFVPFAKLFD